MRSVVWLVPVLAVTIAKPAVGQEKGQVGLTVGYPASVGVVWHAVDRVAVRPEFTFTQISAVDSQMLVDCSQEW